ncbi:MAG: L-aspartate oxidase [Bdellovibrionales bacterium RIFOXYC1_FULL_54_43]|nr:MAG: L-aspartate oxidase [Bdellovibrionales bacterium RIFOXYC1_FULL_54_43]OFZ84428.1 MAG: L-aspartate oxidase [Bdellovibrionales bacterium RIFOXYD1_FULL_55_31]
MPSTSHTPVHTPVLILGTGIAGLSTAIKFAQKGIAVTLVCKSDRAEGATRYAQGGIASVWSKDDSFDEHKKDTQVAGAGLCNEDVVDLCVREGPARIRELIELGVKFTRTHDAVDPTESFDLHREGGHGQRRILHADDLTGWAIERALLEQVTKSPLIRVLENHIAVDLITEAKTVQTGAGGRQPGQCFGAYVLSPESESKSQSESQSRQSGAVITITADITVLATGGAGKVYLYTSNPDIATGDGIAMAYRAGAKIANLEFMQFHPTCLYHPSARTFLISEAMRGEGALLKTLDGKEFMSRYHPMASLAPRDVVARAIDMEMKRTGDKHVVLDATHIKDLKRKFPHIYESCQQFGIDIAEGPIPVVPACHYTCGGVRVDANARTNIGRLYAVGEVACTGLHGANRLASNSLLEAVVFGHRLVEHSSALLSAKAKDAQSDDLALTPVPIDRVPQWDSGKAVPMEERIDIAANWLEIRHIMWNYVGIVRSNRRLDRAKRRIDLLKAEVNAYYWDYLLTKDLVELRNLLLVAELIVECALRRKESRGLHYTVDFPKLDDKGFKRDTVL